MANQTQELLTPIKSYDITNDDVQKTGEYGEYYILITHNLDSLHPIVEWYDENSNIRSHTGNIRVIDQNSLVVYCGGEITGTHKVNILVDKSNMLKGRRLFDQPLTEPNMLDNTYRIAIGRPGMETRNMTIGDFSSGVAQTIGSGFLMRDNNLSDLASVESARTNLNVYSKGEADTKFMSKTDSTNLDILSSYVPADYPGDRPLDGNTVLTYELAQKLDRTRIYPAVAETIESFNKNTLGYTIIHCRLESMLKFNVKIQEIDGNTKFQYVPVFTIKGTEYPDIINSLPAGMKADNTVVYACEGMPIIDPFASRYLDYPAVSSHLQIVYKSDDGGSLEFNILPTVAGRGGLTFTYTGQMILND